MNVEKEVLKISVYNNSAIITKSKDGENEHTHS